MDATDVTFYSNRSACHANLNQWEQAAEDARQCVIIDPKFVKGYYRAGLALEKLGDLDAALGYVERGLAIDPKNADLKQMFLRLIPPEIARRLQAITAFATEGDKMVQDIKGLKGTLSQEQFAEKVLDDQPIQIASR